MSDTIITMPSAPLAEKSIIGAMMDDPQNNIRRALGDGLRPEMFYHYALLFSEVCAFYKEHGIMEVMAFVQALQLSGKLDKIGSHDGSHHGASSVMDVYGHCIRSGSWSIYEKQLRETYAQRLAIRAAHRLGEAQDSSEAASITEDALEALREAVRGPKRACSIKEAADDFIKRLEAAYLAGDLPGSSTGILPLDAVSGGMRPGEFWVIGGKPSRGKSVLMLQIAAEFIEREENVGVFSLEMMSHEIIGRLVSVAGRVNYGAITQPRTANKGDLMRIQKAVGKLATAPLWIDASAGQTIEGIYNEAVRIRDMAGSISLVVVDYLQLIQGQRGRNESREQEIARVSGSLKQLAKELNCPVLSASQLNEQGQTRESRAIEQDADALLFIVEDGVKIGKLRNGRRNDLLPLYLHGQYQKFLETRPEETL